MNTLAPPPVPAPQPEPIDGFRPPAAGQSAVPAAFASLTWPADIEPTDLPAPLVGGAPQPQTFAPPAAPVTWAAPASATVPFEPGQPLVDDGSSWSWTPVMDRHGSEPTGLRSPEGGLSIRLDALEAAFDARATEPAASATRVEPITARADAAMPDVSFEAAAGTVTTTVTPVAAVVTATVPAFATYRPGADLVLPDAPVREPMSVEIREAVVTLPPERRSKRRRSGRPVAMVLLVAVAASSAAYLGLREYIYGDSTTASDGTRVVEVEPSRTIVVVDAP